MTLEYRAPGPAQPSDPVEYRATVRALRLTAQRVLAAHAEAEALEKELRVLVEAAAPVLLAQPGVGPITAAQLLVSWSHPGRLRSEAAFAMLAGVAPIEASSGQVVRHRLNRGGDRQLNRALHTIVMIRQRYHQRTMIYTSRRIAEGKSEREVRRCLTRAVARAVPAAGTPGSRRGHGLTRKRPEPYSGLGDPRNGQVLARR